MEMQLAGDNFGILLVQKESEKKLFLQNVSRLIECSFDKPAEKFSPKVRKQFTQIREKIIILLKLFFQPKCSYGHVKRTFGNPAEKILLQCQKKS